MEFTLHPQLQADCYQLGQTENGLLLLHKNALVPWFILVPFTDEQELFKLNDDLQAAIQNDINAIAGFTEQHFSTDKLNIATIGNVVPQLHIHIIGRFKTDFCWPKPVWGQTETSAYTSSELETIKFNLSSGNILRPLHDTGLIL